MKANTMGQEYGLAFGVQEGNISIHLGNRRMQFESHRCLEYRQLSILSKSLSNKAEVLGKIICYDCERTRAKPVD